LLFLGLGFLFKENKDAKVISLEEKHGMVSVEFICNGNSALYD
jgi:hypothetical protein